MAKHFLVKQDGEFYPFGGLVDKDGQYKNVGRYDSDDFPLSQSTINELEKYFEGKIESGTIRSYAITFDSLARKDDVSEKTDAIAIRFYSTLDGKRATYYYPYKIRAKDKVEIGDPWGKEGH